jgi:hypothetical protein
MYCESCGLQIFPKHPVCTRCGHAPTLQLLQLTSLLTIFVAVLGNTLVAWFLLPRFELGRHAFYFHSWMWISQKAAAYGWAGVALGLLAWDYFVWRKSRPKIKGWLTRKLLTFVLVAGITPFIPWWVPAGQPPQNFMTMISRYPGLPIGLAWGAVLFVVILLCVNAESRLALLGKGRVLSAVGLSALVALLTATMIGWSFVS